jgi:hypothetical protein
MRRELAKGLFSQLIISNSAHKEAFLVKKLRIIHEIGWSATEPRPIGENIPHYFAYSYDHYPLLIVL